MFVASAAAGAKVRMVHQRPHLSGRTVSLDPVIVTQISLDLMDSLIRKTKHSTNLRLTSTQSLAPATVTLMAGSRGYKSAVDAQADATRLSPPRSVYATRLRQR